MEIETNLVANEEKFDQQVTNNDSPENGEDFEDGEVVEDKSSKQLEDDAEDGEVSDDGVTEEGGKIGESNDKSDTPRKESSQRKINRICQYHANGRCYKGNNCPLIHADNSMSGPRGPMNPAQAMMMMAAMRGTAPNAFMRPMVSNSSGVPPLFTSPTGQGNSRFPFSMYGFKNSAQSGEPESQYSVKTGYPGEMDQENEETQTEKKTTDEGGVSSAWELGLKRAKELKKQAELRRKMAAENPSDVIDSKPISVADWKSPSDPIPKKHSETSNKKDLGERKTFRLDDDSHPVDPWRRGSAVTAAHRSRPRDRRRTSRSGSENSGSRSSSSGSSYTGSSYSGSSASSASGSSFSGSSYSGSSRSGSTGSSYSSYSGSSYSGSSRSRSRSPHKRANRSKKRPSGGGKASIPAKSRPQQSTKKTNISSKPPVSASTKASSHKAAPSSTVKSPVAIAKPQASSAQSKPVVQQKAASSTSAPGQKRPAVSNQSQAGGSSTAKSAKLSKDDIMRQIAKLDAAIAKKRTGGPSSKK